MPNAYVGKLLRNACSCLSIATRADAPVILPDCRLCFTPSILHTGLKMLNSITLWDWPNKKSYLRHHFSYGTKLMLPSPTSKPCKAGSAPPVHHHLPSCPRLNPLV